MSSFILQHIASTVGIQLYTTETQCIRLDAGLPTKYETPKTIVQNLKCLLPFIHDSLYMN